jgi:peptide-methionine (R)-S-oxide reductase
MLIDGQGPSGADKDDGVSRVQKLGRRAFILSAAGAVSTIAFWGLRRSTVAAARPLEANEGPANVTVVQFSANDEKTETVTVPRLIKSDDEWRRELAPASYWVLRHSDTERPFTNDKWDPQERGIFRCAGCDLALFSSAARFDAGTGWPSFWQPIAPENVVETVDGSLMEVRTAVFCRLCYGHLGHVFNDGPPPTGLRYCMNSVAMRFVKLG